MRRPITANVARHGEVSPGRRVAQADDPCKLADAELLAILAGGSNPLDVERAASLLRRLGGPAALAQADFWRLRAAGMAPRAVRRFVATVELIRRGSVATTLGRILDSPEAAASALVPHFAHLEHEAVRVALLTRRSQLLDVISVSDGGVAQASVRIGELFSEALRRNVGRLILAHNHPSGDATPSADDERTTREAIRAGRILGVEVVDHIVFGRGEWVSFRQLGRLFLDE